jgi:hypothetical protein
MEGFVKQNQGLRAALQTIRYSIILGIALFLGFITYNYFQKPDQFLGKEVIYQNTFKTAVEVIPAGPDRYIWTECIRKHSSLVMTVDTVVFKTDTGAMGLKPVEVGSHGELICYRQDKAIVLLIQVIPKDKKDVKSKRYLIIVQPEGSLILNPVDKCITESDLK